MSSRPVLAFTLDSNGDCTNPKNQSISELVWRLRIAYRSKDFDGVEEILVAREMKLKREFENKKKENVLLTEKFQSPWNKQKIALIFETLKIWYLEKGFGQERVLNEDFPCLLLVLFD